MLRHRRESGHDDIGTVASELVVWLRNVTDGLADLPQVLAIAPRLREVWLLGGTPPDGRAWETIADELDSIAARLGDEPATPAPPPPAPVRPTRPPEAKPGPRPAASRAAQSYEWVCKIRPDLVGELRPPQRYSRRMWQHIRDNGCPAYEGVEVPAFETWKRQVRAGTADPGGPGG